MLNVLIVLYKYFFISYFSHKKNFFLSIFNIIFNQFVYFSYFFIIISNTRSLNNWSHFELILLLGSVHVQACDPHGVCRRGSSPPNLPGRRGLWSSIPGTRACRDAPWRQWSCGLRWFRPEWEAARQESSAARLIFCHRFGIRFCFKSWSWFTCFSKLLCFIHKLIIQALTTDRKSVV